MEQAGAAGDTKGLYPGYIRSFEVYHCPNSDVNTPRSMDINPSTRKLDPGRFAARCSLVWTPLLDAPPGDPAQRALYDRQLRWKTVPYDMHRFGPAGPVP